jgi:hypothetical protein
MLYKVMRPKDNELGFNPTVDENYCYTSFDTERSEAEQAVL